MSALKIIVVGCDGRMGKEVVELVKASDDLELLASFDRGQNIEELKFEQGCVVVDFSDSELFPQLFDWCALHKVALVSGTTALSQEDQRRIEQAHFPILWAPNMSVGVAFVNKLMAQFKVLAKEFDFQIEEVHHRYKKDKPSGTAILLQESLQEAVGEKLPEPLSIRGGGVFGEHRVLAMSDEEVIKIEHVALNRKVWASGALRAARWLSGQGPGCYSIEDVLS